VEAAAVRAPLLCIISLLHQKRKKKEAQKKNKAKKKKGFESARGPSRVLAHKVRRKLTTNAFEAGHCLFAIKARSRKFQRRGM
jgi:hypothetical protein